MITFLLSTLAVFCVLAAFAAGWCGGIAYYDKHIRPAEPGEPPTPRAKPTWIQPQPQHRLPHDKRL
jgi:hypothetical protein